MLLFQTLKCLCPQSHCLCLSPWVVPGHREQPRLDPCPLGRSPKGFLDSSGPPAPSTPVFLSSTPLSRWFLLPGKPAPAWSFVRPSELSRRCYFLLVARTSPGQSMHLFFSVHQDSVFKIAMQLPNDGSERPGAIFRNVTKVLVP